MKEAKQLFAFMSSYEQLVSSKVATCDLTDEYYDQINLDDLEFMDLKWNMATIVTKIKKYMEWTSNDLPTISKRIWFYKLIVNCYNYEESCHFAKECDKQGREYPQNNTQDRNSISQKKYNNKESKEVPQKILE